MKQKSSPPAPHAKCGPQTSSTGVTREFVTNAETQAPPQIDASGRAFEQETQGMCLYVQGWETLPLILVPAFPCASQSSDVKASGVAPPGVFKWDINFHSWSYKEHLPLTTKFLQPPMRAWYAHTRPAHTHKPRSSFPTNGLSKSLTCEPDLKGLLFWSTRLCISKGLSNVLLRPKVSFLGNT